MKRHRLELILYLLAAVIMIVRVDIWWWGSLGSRLFLGWISVPMIYQFAMFVAGYALVTALCLIIWKTGPEKEPAKIAERS